MLSGPLINHSTLALRRYTDFAKSILHGVSSGQLGIRGTELVNILSIGVDLLAASGLAKNPRNTGK